MNPFHHIRRLEKKAKQIDLELYKKRSALESDYSNVITDSIFLVDEGEIKVIYLDLDQLNFDSAEIIGALQRIKYNTTERTGGLKTTSRIFGYSPRVTLRKDFCSSTSLVHDFPTEHEIVCKYAKQVSEIYKSVDQTIYKKHQTMSDKVLKDWTIEDTPFTSGIINKNNPLKYHFDTGNFKDVYSCMLGFKHDIQGGYLSLPEYDLALEIKNNSLLIFDGQNILHGVTPIKQLSPQAYRYTIVYYSLRAMWKCLTVDEELIRIRKIKTERERNRAVNAENKFFSKVR